MKLVPSRRWLWGGVALALVAPVAALLPGSLSVLLAIDALWIALLLVDAALAPGARALALQREVPVAFSVGRAFVVRYRWVHRLGRRLTVVVKEHLPEPLGGALTPLRRLELPPRLEVEEQLELQPLRRGIGTGGTIDLRILGPLGLAWRQGRLEAPWTATVYPGLRGTSIRALPMQTLRRREAGLRSVRQRGEGRLFEGLREWVPGDDTRIIDWKATARRGKPIARQYEDERRQQVMLLVDAGRLLTAEVDGVPRLEAVISAALHLAYAAVEHDDDVGLLVFADTIQRYVAPGRGRRALRAVLEGLAAAEGRLVESDYPGALRYLALHSRKRALTVLFTDVIDRTASEALVAQAATLRPRHLPLAVTLRDPAMETLASTRPADQNEAFQRAAAEELLGAREAALAEMRSRGVMVLDVLPNAAASALVERYHLLKRKGTL
ncbi:MAG TPA: DUF58 domain-containing protein [Gemmatimonadales bacterium]|nr:DUF58 domain-containing protein [Gemmatimonadales bacterium]